PVVARKGVETDDEQSVAPGRAKARIELVAGTGPMGRAHERQDTLRRAHVFLGKVVVLVSAVVVDEEDVEVRSVAALATTELSHRDHREAAGETSLGERATCCVLERRVRERAQHDRGIARTKLASELRQTDFHRDACLRVAEGTNEGIT